MVAPSGRRSMAISSASLVPSRARGRRASGVLFWPASAGPTVVGTGGSVISARHAVGVEAAVEQAGCCGEDRVGGEAGRRALRPIAFRAASLWAGCALAVEGERIVASWRLERSVINGSSGCDGHLRRPTSPSPGHPCGAELAEAGGPLGVLALLEGHVVVLLEQAGVVAEGANMAPVDLLGAGVEVLGAEGGQPRQHHIDLGLFAMKAFRPLSWLDLALASIFIRAPIAGSWPDRCPRMNALASRLSNRKADPDQRFCR